MDRFGGLYSVAKSWMAGVGVQFRKPIYATGGSNSRCVKVKRAAEYQARTGRGCGYNCDVVRAAMRLQLCGCKCNAVTTKHRRLEQSS